MTVHWFDKLEQITGMQKQKNNPFGCGSYFIGNEEIINGNAWYYSYNDLMVVSKCDFVFTKDVHVRMDERTQFLRLRLDYGRSLGKILAFLDDDRDSFDMYIRKGTRFAYTEVIFYPKLYNEEFHKEFSEITADPVEIIKSMGTEHNWPVKISESLWNIRNSNSTGTAAELFYIGESYKLLSALIEMGTTHIPHKITDFDDIQHVIHYIEQHYREDIKQADLVQIANMSPTKLKTLFKTVTEHSITEYIAEKRATSAAKMLAESSQSIEEIAHAVGFTTVAGFSSLFRKKYGVSPSEYRKQMGYVRVDSISYLEAMGVKVTTNS